jgi:23S rRNA pseudouridine955/2504/2580 synthase
MIKFGNPILKAYNASFSLRYTVNSVQFLKIHSEYAGQRLDNYLLARLKGVPKSHIYKILRKGEVRVNKKRAKPEYRLQANDEVRIPPVRVTETTKMTPSSQTFEWLKAHILYEDNNLLILNKPSGIPVHGGSEVPNGVIEVLRHYLPHSQHLELAHRLDRDTSGCLVMAKKRSILKEVHALLREGKVKKTYHALVLGKWNAQKSEINAPLMKNQLASGERMVRVSPEGQESLTYFKPLTYYSAATLVEARPHTGRTHQIRVHAQFAGHPIAGDEKYGDKAFNRYVKELGLKRLFLHAAQIEFNLDNSKQNIQVKAPLPLELQQILDKMATP